MTKIRLISVVDDDRFFLDSMRRLLKSLGYASEPFASAGELLASPRLAETACLIADVHMPAMTGIELHKRLREMGHAIPTILVTAYPSDADRADSIEEGVSCYLRKPVDEQELTRCLRTALASSKAQEGS